MSESVEFVGDTTSTWRVVIHWLVFKGLLVTSKPRRLKYTHCVLIKGVMEGWETLLLRKAGVVALEMKGTPCQTWPTHPCCFFHSGHAVSQLLLVLRYAWDQPVPLWGKEAARRELKCAVPRSHNLGAGAEGCHSTRTLTLTPPGPQKGLVSEQSDARGSAARSPRGSPGHPAGPVGAADPRSPSPRHAGKAGPGRAGGEGRRHNAGGAWAAPGAPRGLPDPAAPRGAASPAGPAATPKRL